VRCGERRLPAPLLLLSLVALQLLLEAAVLRGDLIVLLLERLRAPLHQQRARLPLEQQTPLEVDAQAVEACLQRLTHRLLSPQPRPLRLAHRLQPPQTHRRAQRRHRRLVARLLVALLQRLSVAATSRCCRCRRLGGAQCVLGVQLGAGGGTVERRRAQQIAQRRPLEEQRRLGRRPQLESARVPQPAAVGLRRIGGAASTAAVLAVAAGARGHRRTDDAQPPDPNRDAATLSSSTLAATAAIATAAAAAAAAALATTAAAAEVVEASAACDAVDDARRDGADRLCLLLRTQLLP